MIRHLRDAVFFLALVAAVPAAAQTPPVSPPSSPAGAPLLTTAVFPSGSASAAVGAGQMLYVTSAAELLAKTVAAPLCGLLQDGQYFGVTDEAMTAQSGNITISPAAGSIESGASYVMMANGQARVWRCHGATANWLPIGGTGVLDFGTQSYTGTGVQPAMTATAAIWSASSPEASITIPLPLSPHDHDCRTAVNSSQQDTYPLIVSGNGKTIGPGSETAIGFFGPSAMTLCYSAAAGYWSQVP